MCGIINFLVAAATAADPCVSGLQPGQRPGPFSFLVATGPQRGQQTCYVCETGDKPAVVIFARKLTEPLGKLIAKADDWQLAQPKDGGKCWMVVLGEKTATLDQVAKWTKQAGIKTVPVGVYDDVIGPPTYKLSDAADVTVLLWKDRKVVGNFAFREGELNDEAIKTIEGALKKHGEK
jgi:hypothetical protein